ncbi:MAG: sortase [Candidatus Saccharibacteria bacterium]|nr:sortase [Candidatus Saccharibacteria bacterium]
MKNYLLVLLTVLGVGILLGQCSNKTDDVFATDTVSTNEVAEIQLFSELESANELAIEQILETANISQPIYYDYTFTSVAQPAAPSVLNYNVVNRPTITKDPGYTINKTGKLIWGHNDANLLLSAQSLRAGSVFNVTDENGVVNSYTVSSTRIYAISELEAMIPGTKRNRMWEVAYKAQDDAGVQHRVAILTCYEQVRNAAHRFVVYAD